MNEMTTLSRVLNVLKERGYTEDFNLTETSLVAAGNALKVFPDEFVVDKHYRFEGPSDPADEAIVYAISSAKHNIKGTLVNGYGMYSDKISDDMVSALKENYNQEASFEGIDHEDNTTEEKSNRATELRPEGDRVLDAQLVEIDLNAFRQQIKEEQAWIDGDRNAITIYKSNGMRIVLIALHTGAEMKTHTAPGVISVQVLEGKITFGTAEETIKLTEGQMVTLHKRVPHSVFADRESTFLLTLATPSVENENL
ncbi:MAG TPA: cupin domain-containing protein [Sphingobacteriaceae bacterium]|nr:cupin domain-containing protein [Sphingobacteriaceae bacterium]